MNSPLETARQLRKWSHDCSGHEPSLSCLQRAADDAADLIEIVWRLVKLIVFAVPVTAAVCGLWFKLGIWQTVLARLQAGAVDGLGHGHFVHALRGEGCGGSMVAQSANCAKCKLLGGSPDMTDLRPKHPVDAIEEIARKMGLECDAERMAEARRICDEPVNADSATIHVTFTAEDAAASVAYHDLY